VQSVRPVPGGVLLERTRVGDTELRSEVCRDRPRHLGRVGQERAQETDGAELDGEPEAVVLAAPHVDQIAVGVVQVEVAVELGLVRIAGVPAVATLLLRAEEPFAGPPGRPRLDRHRAQSVRSAPGPARRYW